MSKFFDELMESVQEVDEILRGERRPSTHDRRPTSSTQISSGYPTMNLAPNFPDDATMHLLIQLLHEEIGLPERKTIHLTTSINFDLGCNGADAQHLIETLEDQFHIDFVDYDSYRYFQPEGYDVHLKRKAKGRGDKEPLTIGTLYRAIKAQRWDTRELEDL